MRLQLACFVLTAACLGLRLEGAPPPVSLPTDMENLGPNGAETGPFAFIDSRSSYVLGNLWGLRTLLSRYGISLGLQETSEELGNVSGGVQQGFDYDGLTQAVLQLDTQRAFHVYGGTFDISALQIHGDNLSAENLDTLQTASGIEADRATRLWELWYQQKFLEEDRVDVKIGQQSLDQEFMVSQDALVFVNTMFGWPMLPSADLPGGGPAYPLSALGLRLRARPWNSWTVLAGVFNGNPAPSAAGDPQKADPAGTSFPLDGGALAIAEIQYSYPALGSMTYASDAQPLARTFKLGAWYDSESFPDEELAAFHRGDYAVYAVADQTVWEDADDPDRNAAVFVRPMWTPLSDRNLVDFSTNVGLAMHEPFLHRDDDTFGLGMGFAHVSRQAAALDRQTAALAGLPLPIRSHETFLEITYQFQLRPWWQIQPDFQYVLNPGGGIPNPHSLPRRIGNEAVLGLRTNFQL